MTYREITFAKNQQIADRLLSDCDITEKSNLPIDPEAILRKKGHLVIPMLNMKRNYGVLGCVAKSGRSLQVYIDEYYYLNEPDRSLFTLGEELGHIYLHLFDLENVKSVEDWIKVLVANSDHHKRIEAQARLFSSNILLPHYIFDPFVLRWVKQNINQLKAFPRISPGTLADTIALFLEDELGVSQSILSIVLRRWPDQLIGRITKNHPGLLSDEEY